MARKTIVINGTSVVSSQPITWLCTWSISALAVSTPTRTSTVYVRRADHNCSP